MKLNFKEKFFLGIFCFLILLFIGILFSNPIEVVYSVEDKPLILKEVKDYDMSLEDFKNFDPNEKSYELQYEYVVSQICHDVNHFSLFTSLLVLLVWLIIPLFNLVLAKVVSKFFNSVDSVLRLSGFIQNVLEVVTIMCATATLCFYVIQGWF